MLEPSLVRVPPYPMFKEGKEYCDAKVKARMIRIDFTLRFLRYTNPFKLTLYSLPGFNGMYEKTIFNELRIRKIAFDWNAYEHNAETYYHVRNPFGDFKLKQETPGVRVGGYPWARVAYANTDMAVDPGHKNPVIIDGDFCGYPSQEILDNCLFQIPANSLVMLTFWTGWRGWTVGDRLADSIRHEVLSRLPYKGTNGRLYRPVLKNAYEKEIKSHISRTMQGCFERATLIHRHDYWNNGAKNMGQGSPMVLLIYHTMKYSPLCCPKSHE